MQIRVYNSSDFDGVQSLWEEAFPDDPSWNWAQSSVPEKIAFQPDLLFVATQGSEIIGTIMAGYDGHRGWLYSVAVRQTARREGTGAKLVRHAEQALMDLGCGKINLQVRATNTALIEFYERLGYVTEERISLGKRLGTEG